MSTKTVTAKKHVAGRQPESATLRNALIQRDGCTSDLCTEEILFGLGGGIGCAYFLFDRYGGHPVYIGSRIHAKEGETPYFTLQITEGWGATADVRHSSSPSAATKSLVKILNDGFTPIVWVEITKLPYMFLSGRPNAYHQVVVYGMEGDDVLVGDLGDSVIRMSMESLPRRVLQTTLPGFVRWLSVRRPPNPSCAKPYQIEFGSHAVKCSRVWGSRILAWRR